MKKITFIHPAIGKKPGAPYIKTWKMEPLPVAALATLTPGDIECEFFDDRMELIDYETETDLVAITVETYTARRAYDIARRFRERGLRVVMGGYHPTHLPDEAAAHCDAVVTGNAETVWKQLLQDADNGGLRRLYNGGFGAAPASPDRSVFGTKGYLDVGLVEAGRGCPFTCEFCHITTYYEGTHHPRPIADVVADVEKSGKKFIFFVDDNLVANPGYALRLFNALVPLNIRWSGQGTLTMAKHPDLLRAMRRSGCVLMLVGFESLEGKNLDQMGKSWSMKLGDRDELIGAIHAEGIGIYATFLFGFDHDTPDVFARSLEFALKHDFFYAAFNHLLPFPETPLYWRLVKERRMIRPRWWLDPNYRYGDIAFQPRSMDPESLSAHCVSNRKAFFRHSSIAKRAFALLRRKPEARLLSLFLMSNLSLRDEVMGRLGLPLGDGLDELPK